jgi:hypothetical protein
MTTAAAPAPVPEFPMDLLDNLDPTAATTPPPGDGDEGDDSGDASGDAGGEGAGGAGADGAAGAGDGDNAAAGGEGSDDPSGAAGDGAAADAGRPRNADGTFKSKEQLAAEAEAAGVGKPPEGKTPAAPKKPADPINDPIPTNLKPATAERMGKLVETAKTLTSRAETAEQERDLLLQSVADTGMNGEEFGEFLGVVKDARSGDPAAIKRAYEYMGNVVKALATELGVAPPGVDPLTGHTDLIQRVNAGSLTRKDAEELAATRRLQQANEQRTQRTAQQSQQTAAQAQQLQQAVATAKENLGEWETTLASADPNFPARKAAMLADTAWVAGVKAMHPTKWVAEFSKKYRETKVTPKVVPVAQRSGSAPQPLRGNKAPAGGGAQVTTPKSMEEAIGAIDFSKI